MKLIYLGLLSFILFSFASGEPDLKELDILIDNWHQAATGANFEAYFGVTTEDFVFLGTAPGERWDKESFMKFCKPYFDNGKAWDFKASNRNWVVDPKCKIVWFDEDLDTWMRGCRGSGILRKVKGEWKIAYYNLTVLIENDKIEYFKKLRDAEILED